MSILDSIIESVKEVLTGRKRNQAPRPASEDPYGDPADQERGGYGNVRPASEDPYGDPADEERRR